MEVRKAIERFKDLEKLAFDENVNIAFDGSINLARGTWGLMMI